ncbi:MAG TPA: CvpA family protein [Flavitalea sp.]|nr:CvpA family protein [Flavitalea sp.]
MVIDLAFLVMLLFAIIKGLQKGLIIGIFSLVAFIVGLAAALKLSSVVASYLAESTNISSKWLPFVSFILVFLLMVVLVNLGARLLEKTAEAMMLGPVNKIGGIFFYLFLETIIFSVILFFFVQVKWVGDETIASSKVYPYVQPIGPWVINGIGKIFPTFQDLFKDLEKFFEGVAEKATDGKSAWQHGVSNACA